MSTLLHTCVLPFLEYSKTSLFFFTPNTLLSIIYYFFFFRGGSWVSKGLQNFSRITEPVGEGVRSWTPCWVHQNAPPWRRRAVTRRTGAASVAGPAGRGARLRGRAGERWMLASHYIFAATETWLQYFGRLRDWDTPGCLAEVTRVWGPSPRNGYSSRVFPALPWPPAHPSRTTGACSAHRLVRPATRGGKRHPWSLRNLFLGLLLCVLSRAE